MHEKYRFKYRCLAGRAMLFFTHAAVMSALAHPIDRAYHAPITR